MKIKGILVVIIIAVAFLGYNAAYIVDETEQVIITQFGKIIGEPKTDPGLKFKIPFIQKANYFAKNLLDWDGDPGQIPTLDKTFIWVDVFARWKITDPIKFFQTVNNRFNAIGKLNDIIDPAAKKITQGILSQAQPKLTSFGIELVDVKIKRINYVEQVRKSVYDRMIAERKQIAEKFRSEGKGEAQKILGEKERDLQEIQSEAYRTAQETKGKADAEATIIYARAYGVDPEFYSFVQTLEVYTESLGEKNTLILSTDSEFLKYLKEYPQ